VVNLDAKDKGTASRPFFLILALPTHQKPRDRILALSMTAPRLMSSSPSIACFRTLIVIYASGKEGAERIVAEITGKGGESNPCEGVRTALMCRAPLAPKSLCRSRPQCRGRSFAILWNRPNSRKIMMPDQPTWDRPIDYRRFQEDRHSRQSPLDRQECLSSRNLLTRRSLEHMAVMTP